MSGSSPSGATREIELEGSTLLCVVGSNPKISDACREILKHLCPAGYHVQECGSSDAPSGCDIYIWDLDSSPSLPSVMVTAKDAARVVIVNNSSPSSVRRRLQGAEVTYLQSPGTPTLRTVLESAIARRRMRLNHDRIKIQANPRLHEPDQDRTNFLRRAIHDLRVPLMATQGYCDLFLAGQLGPLDPEQTRILEKMQRSLCRLHRLTEAMMDLGTGSLITNKLRLEHAGIEACVQQAVHEVLPVVEGKQIRLNVDVQAPNGAMVFDSGQLEQVLVNLLDNACKFTPRRGSITVGGRSITAAGLGEIGLPEATAGYRIDITDTGRGIDAALIEQIFDEHTSYSAPMDRSSWGLGLAICRMIIQAHGGRIWANSNTQGASFSFVLPLASTISV